MTAHEAAQKPWSVGSSRDRSPASPPPVARPPRPLSRAAELFERHVEAHPELLARETFEPLMAHLAELIPDLTGKPDEPYGLQPWPTLFDQQAWDEVEAANRSLAALIRSLPERVFAGDWRATAEFYGLESAAMASVLLNEPNGLFETLVRGDWVYTEDGLRCIEVNFGNLGCWQNASLSQRYLDSPPLRRFQQESGIELLWTNTSADVLRHIVSHCMETLDLANDELNVAVIVGDEEANLVFCHPQELYNRELTTILEELGGPPRGRVEVIVPTELEVVDGIPTTRGMRVHATVDQSDRPAGLPLFRAYKAGLVQLYSGPISLVLANKKNHALLSQLADSPLFEPAEREVVRRYIPWTRVVAPGPTDYNGEREQLPRLLRRHKDRFVLKAGVSVGGEQVFVGRALEPQAWEKALAQGLAEGGWVVQEFLDVDTYRYQSGPVGSSPFRAVWGVFTFGDSPAGLFVRLSEVANSPVVNISQGATVGLAFVAREGGR